MSLFLQGSSRSSATPRRELESTNIQLRRLVDVNRDRFSQLAHDFKTPLNSIMGYSQLLLRQHQKLEDEIGKKNTEHIERVLRSSRQLIQMVNDVLEIFRYENCEVQLRLTAVDVGSVIDRTLETVEPLTQQKGLEMVRSYDQAPKQIITDLARLEQILTNLLSNAIRYTAVGHIAVSARFLSETQWSLTVTDTGLGISEEDQIQIFQPFSRASSSKIQEGSTGLGLAIVNQLVELLQGKLELVSTVGKGSSFTIVFPVEVVLEERSPERRLDN